jgi:RNA polymerase sigma-70 factor (ECF subfamily)
MRRRVEPARPGTDQRRSDVGVEGDRELEEFERFFVRTSSLLVGQAFLLVGDLHEAQDLAQETLVRMWDRWPKVSKYDDPTAWARRVLHNLAVSRLRRRALERRHASIAVTASPAPSADAVDLARSLQRLPPAQRRALVLHEVLGLTTEEVADEMRAATGSVRKWLYRARTALAVDLRLDEEHAWSRPSTVTKEARS